MIAAIVLMLIVIAYRVFLGIAGSADFGWLHNFCPLAAVALCGAIYLPKRFAFALPLTALFVSDLLLNAFYRVPLLNAAMIPQYFALGLIAALGWLLRANPRLVFVLLASIGGSVFFYLITNTGAWMAEPLYAKTAAGWAQALTVGLPGFPPTLYFFRNTVLSDLAFTLLFYACMAVQHGRPAPAKMSETAAW